MTTIDIHEFQDYIAVIEINYDENSEDPSNIIGFFMSKGKGSITINTRNSTVSGKDLIYIDNNKEIADMTSLDEKQFFFVRNDSIYSVSTSKLQIEENTISGFNNIIPKYDFSQPECISGKCIINDPDKVSNNIVIIYDKLTELFKTNEVNNIFRIKNTLGPIDNTKTIVTMFKYFIDNFIIQSIIFQINSLNLEQINGLFEKILFYILDDTRENTYFETKINDIKIEFLKIIYHDIGFIESNNAVNQDINNINKYINNSNDFKNSINNDTNNYVGLIGAKNLENTYIHIYTIIEILNECVHNGSFWLQNAYQNAIINDIISIIDKLVIKYSEPISINTNKPNDENVNNIQNISLMTFLKSFSINQNENFKIKLNEKMKENASDKIITYVRINNFDKKQRYNKRFNISIAEKNNAMIIGYNDDNLPYYKKNDSGEFVFNTNIITHIEKGKERDITYKKQYLFGNYTEIFGPDLTNTSITEKMNIVIEKVVAGKPVFILGYGASGAGKTSTLVYYNKGEGDARKGIVINICNQLADKGYRNINMKVEEYFLVNNRSYRNVDDKSEDNPIVNTTRYYNFEYENATNDKNAKPDFYLTNDEKIDITHAYRYGNSVKVIKPPDLKTMGEIMIELIDKNRFVKATTNNPQSSRSHSMTYLELIHNTTGKKGYIIIGDYAGIENEFTCNNSSTIIDFLEVKRDCINKPCQEYYKDEYFFPPGNTDDKHLDPFHDASKILYDAVFDKSFKDHIKDFVTLYSKTSFDSQSFNNSIFKNNLHFLYYVFKNNLQNITKITVDSVNVESVNTLFYFIVKNNFDEAFVNIQQALENIQNDALKIEAALSDNVYTSENKNTYTMCDKYKDNYLVNLFCQIIINTSDYDIVIEKLRKISTLSIEENEDDLIIKYNPDKELQFMLYVLNKVFVNKPAPGKKATNFKVNEGKYVLAEVFHKIIKDTNNTEFFKELQHFQITCADVNDIYEFFKSIVTKQNVRNIVVLTKNKCIQIQTSPMDSTHINKWYDSLINNELFKKKYDDILQQLIPSNITIKIYNPTTKSIIGIDYQHLKHWYKIKNQTAGLNNTLKATSYFHMFKDINDSGKFLNDVNKSVEIIQSLKDKIDRLNTMVSIGKKICENRVVEGKFINKSLHDIRDTIKDIVSVKTKDKIFNSPDYVDFCLEKYCPTHTDCFKYKSTANTNYNSTDTKFIKSLLIRSIYNYIKSTKARDETYTIEMFYKEILISVFCVFNISMDANNPPSIPYIDINELKQSVMLYDKNKTNDIKNVLIRELVFLYCKLGKVHMTNDNKIVEHDSNGPTFIKQLEYKYSEYITEFVNKKFTTFNNNQITNIIKSIAYKKIYTFLKEYANHDIDDEQISNIKDLITTVDANNAVSAIGTLEFTDQIAKYNTTQTICNTTDIDTTMVDNYKTLKHFKLLYS